MSLKKNIIILFHALIIMVFFSHCASDKPEPLNTVILKWPKAYPAEDWEKVRTGLYWSLSFIGAELPAGSGSMVFSREGTDRIIFDPSKAGFNESSLHKINTILDALKESEEYRNQGSADLGRFLMLSIYSSWNYYALTGAEKSITDFKKKYQTGNEQKFAATNSTVALHDRLITLGISNELSTVYFIAEEGTGSLSDGTFQTVEYETISFMPNGQPRFAIYDINGNLKDAGDTSLTLGGKPGKCMWCHESNVLPLFSNNSNIAGFITQEEFNQQILHVRQFLENFRNQLNTEIDFRQTQDHTFSELLYNSFMEPSAFRLSREWNMKEEDVKEILQSLATHINSEAAFLGDLFDRHAVEKYAPYKSTPVPFSAREKSVFEPDYFNFHP